MSKIILLDSIRSMNNVGAIFRNADGSRFDRIILTGHTPYPPRRDISKTALGAETWIFWEYHKESIEVVKQLKSNGYSIYCVELDDNSVSYEKLFQDNEEKVCLIMGNEITGVSKKLLDLSDKIISIPMLGKKESLNVSVAAGIVMYALSSSKN